MTQALEAAASADTVRSLLEDGTHSGEHGIGPRGVCALITHLGRAQQCDKVCCEGRAASPVPAGQEGPLG